ncbi:hypothetical protein ACHHYP_09350 [Achlya hypogyna]|uniref:Uncharacterized protein n=1 Tax=Achlya hypogyna TaxID=1202772 RepID=A0A1V9YND6_ACHHY|nr:hypothetical protein ACHHYP_09350 [Achlya hypogyna]
MARPPFPRPIAPSDYDAIIASDKEMYPTDSPLTPEAMAQWYMYQPEFGMIYDGYGCCIVVLVSKATWQAYVRKDIDEAGLVDGIVDALSSSNDEIGLHLYHIEKTQAWTRQFDRMANVVVRDLARILENLNAIRMSKHGLKSLKVVGFSALTASDAGFRMAKNVFGMTQCHAAEEFLFRNRKSRELAVFTAHDLPQDEEEWEREGETRLMALEGIDACSYLFAGPPQSA